MKKKIISMLKEFQSSKELKREVFSKEEYGKTAPIAEYFQDYYFELYETNKKLDEKVSGLDLDSILSPDKIKEPKDIAKSREIVNTLLTEINKYESDFKAIVNKNKEKAKSLNLPKGYKEGFISGIDKNILNSIPYVTEICSIERKILYRADNALEFLEKRQGKYQVTKEGLVFYTDEDVADYNKALFEFGWKCLCNRFRHSEDIYLGRKLCILWFVSDIIHLWTIHGMGLLKTLVDNCQMADCS
jgi:hypothetical protein